MRVVVKYLLRRCHLPIRIYLTEVHTQTDCDVFFPDFAREEWDVKESIFHPADNANDYPFTFSLLEKRGH